MRRRKCENDIVVLFRALRSGSFIAVKYETISFSPDLSAINIDIGKSKYPHNRGLVSVILI